EYRLPTGEVIRTSLHRMVWRLAGRPEARELDHRNLDGLDCRLSNLRPANSIENQRNRPIQTNNTTGVKGVIRLAGCWVSLITVNKRTIYLGKYATIELATIARR